MAKRILWDKYEAVLLLDTCLKVINGEILRKNAIPMLSKKLRYKAEKQGIIIDEVFRNENGISFRLREMEYLVTEHKQGLKTKACKLYREVYKLYLEDRIQYETILKEAKEMVDMEKTVKKD